MRSLVTRALATLALGALMVPAAPAAAYPAAEVRLEGHGFGHGWGMGQYGAWGASRAGLGHEAILRHYYRDIEFRTLAPVNADLRVKIDADEGEDTWVARGGEFSIAAPGCALALTTPDFFWRAVRNADVTLRVERRKVDSPNWEPMCSSTQGPVDFRPSGDPAAPEYERLMRVYLPGGLVKYYRGWVRSLRAGKATDPVVTVNVVGMEDYTKGGVVREMPSWWADPANGGAEALRAQAVAYRSYAESLRNAVRPWDICSTQACQVYGGAFEGDGARPPTPLETANGNAAVDATSAKVMSYLGETVFAQYSSSTGGYSKTGSKPYLTAREDPWDPVPSSNGSLNPNHLWQPPVDIPVARVESAFPEIGRLVSLDVTKRNGLGDWGGRVLEMRIDGTASSIATTGNTFRWRLGLRSDWFRILHPAGYWILGADGGVFTFGNAGFYGSTGAMRLAKPVAGMEATPSKAGYWLVASDGGIFSFGDAQFYGSTGTMRLAKPVIVMASTGSGGGYWLLAADGGIFSFGDAQFFGSTGAMKLNQPIVGMAATPSGRGYWLVASDGGIFSFGDAQFFGSTGAIRLNRPVIGMAATPSGGGYWILASDGGIFSFGDAQFFGSTGAIKLNQPIVGMAATPSGGGYYLLARDGGIFTFGDAQFFGSVPGVAPASTTAKIDIAVSYTQ